MGKRKPKESVNDAAAATITTTTTTTESASTDIFKTLFGNIEQEAATGSFIFSDSNPFKRKPEEPKNDNETENLANQNDDDSKRKRKIEVSSGNDETNEAPLITKEFKKVKTQKPQLGSESNDGNEEKKNKKKKRKRDEVEREYEEKRYGLSVENEAENSNNAVAVGEKRKKPDDITDSLVSKEVEGFDDESKLLRTVFVGNLPLKVKKKAILKEFSQFGEIESVRIRSVPIADTKIPRKGAIMQKKFNDTANSVNAYIVFKTEESAEASLRHNMAVVGGNHIRVDRACPPRKKLKAGDAPLYDNKRTVFVGNLPFDVKDEEIYQLFCSIKDLESSIEAVRVVRDPNVGLGKGIAYVLFKTREAASLAVKKRNLILRNRELRLSHARQDSTPSKRKKEFTSEATNTPNKKFAGGSRTPVRKSVTNASYQGLRASKSGSGKIHSKRITPVKMKSKSPQASERQGKRPSVAARKAKARTLKEGGGTFKQAGKKRKTESRTPERSNRKKARR